MSPTRAEAHSLIRAWYQSGLSSVEPRQAVCRHLGFAGTDLHVGEHTFPIPNQGVIVIAIGKAAVAMAHGARDVLGERIREGAILTKDGHAEHPPEGMRIFEAAHPIPDERGVAGTDAILGLVANLQSDDIVVTLISGGGSALFEAPRDPLTLADLQTTTDLLLRAGAPIQDLNTVRSPLSLVKGGGFRKRMGEASCVSLILSDVPGNDPAVIASGPTIRTTADPSRALAKLEQYGVLPQVPRRVIELLERQNDNPEPKMHVPTEDVFDIIADNDMFVDRIAAAVNAEGLSGKVIWRQQEGEARALGERFVAELNSLPNETEVVLGGGEATVTVHGDGTGGRNTEFALAAAIELHRRGADWVIASLASDGQDGLVDGAGAIADRTTVERASDLSLDARSSLERNDSGSFFERVGGLVAPGPTGTNVNDVYIAVRTRSDER